MATKEAKACMIARIIDTEDGRARLIVRLENGAMLKNKMFRSRAAAQREWIKMYS